jgi:molybdenum storage protein
MTNPKDKRHHLQSMLMRESLLDKEVMAATDRPETPTVRMLPDVHVVKIGSGSILDAGKELTFPVVEALGKILENQRLILGVGGGARSRHVFSVGLDLGLPTGVLAQISMADSLGNAHILGTLLAPYGVVAIPPEIFGHLLPLFINAVPGVIFNGVPPYSLWEHPPAVGRIPPHRTDAGSFMLAECFGCKTMTLVKNVDGLFDRDPFENSSAKFIDEISVTELEKLKLPTLPFDEVLIEILKHTRLVKQFQIINGTKPELIQAAVNGEHVGTIIHSN